MEELINLKWHNRFSHEEGYLKSLLKEDGHFINTFDKSEAKKYTDFESVEKDLAILNEIGETNNNTFVMEPV